MPRLSEGVLPIMAYTGRLHSKGVPFFRLQVYERAENLSFGSVEGPKELTDGFYGFIKSRKRSIFVMLSS